MATRKCNKCGLEKPLDNFTKHPECKFGRAPRCKSCVQVYIRTAYKDGHMAACRRYEKTKRGFLMRLYRNMQSRVSGVQRKKFHLYAGKELLPRENFYEWAFGCQKFHALYAEWVDQGYPRKLAPSVDRIDSSRGYSLDNMEWVTMLENSLRGNRARWGS